MPTAFSLSLADLPACLRSFCSRHWVTGTGGSNRRQPLPRKVISRNAKPLPGRTLSRIGPPGFAYNVASKGFSVRVSLLFATLAGKRVNVAGKGLRVGREGGG